MKKTALILAVLLVIAVFAGCSTAQKAQSQDTQTSDTQVQEAQSQDEEETQTQNEDSSSNDMHYAFEFEDVDGNVHKLSDYEGKPVYLEVWGSWCSVCMSGLEDMNTFAGEDHDYYVLSVVFPEHAGEKSQEDFITWFNELGYKNLTVMFDNDLQIIKDFGIGGFPSNIFFAAQGNFAGGQVGQMSPELIDQVMQGLADEEQ